MFKELKNLAKEDQNRTTAQMAHQLKSVELQKQSLPKNVANELEFAAKVYCQGKDSDSQSQDQDSSSTLSTCQSNHAVSSKPSNSSCAQNMVSELGYSKVYGRNAENCLRSSSPGENADFEMHQAQSTSTPSGACVSLPWTESYYGGFIATYRPNFIYPQMVGMTTDRVPLPVECTESFPIYVNAKQYHAILRRRKIRAKRDAQNKNAASRKPYRHESRHLHATRRARGVGGRFLRTKTETSSPTYKPDSEFQHSRSSTWETSTRTISDVTTIISSGDAFRHPQFNGPCSPFQIGDTMRFGQCLTHHGRTL